VYYLRLRQLVVAVESSKTTGNLAVQVLAVLKIVSAALVRRRKVLMVVMGAVLPLPVVVVGLVRLAQTRQLILPGVLVVTV
jgi:hypothetical protein